MINLVEKHNMGRRKSGRINHHSSFEPSFGSSALIRICIFSAQAQDSLNLAGSPDESTVKAGLITNRKGDEVRQ